MDEELQNAAEKGDVGFLREAIASKPIEYFKSVDEDGHNMFHLAAKYKRSEFLREAMEILAKHLVHFLLCQRHTTWGRTPLHTAAVDGYDKIVKVILEYYDKSLAASSSSTDSQGFNFNDAAPESTTTNPWLLKDHIGGTPFLYITKLCREECALKLLSLDDELFSIIANNKTLTPLIVCLERGFNRVVSKFFASTPNGVWETMDSEVLIRALAESPHCSDEIFRLVLEKNLQLVRNEGLFCEVAPYYHATLNKWAKIGKLYPFEYALKSYDRAARLRRFLISQMTEWGTLHDVASSGNCDEETRVGIAEILVNTYKQEKEKPLNSVQVKPPWLTDKEDWSPSLMAELELLEEKYCSALHKAELPWLKMDRDGCSPLHKAIYGKHERLGLYLLSLEKVESLLEKDDRILFRAIENNCHCIAEKILHLIDQHGLTTLLTSSTGSTVLHYAPKTTDVFLKRLVERHSQLVNQYDDDGVNVLHKWMEIGELRAFEYILKSKDINPQFRKQFMTLLDGKDDEERNPLHVSATLGVNGVIEPIVQLLLHAYQELGFGDEQEFSLHDGDDYCIISTFTFGPWSKRDNEGYTPLDRAISTGHDELALHLLSAASSIGPFYLNDILFKAIDNKCHKALKFLLDQISHLGFKRRLLYSDDKNVLHIASRCTEENGKLIVERWPHLINTRDRNGKTPLEIASEEGTTWLVESILRKDRSSILRTPKGWVGACRKGHLQTILTFVEKTTYFRYICREFHDTPLHHVKFEDYYTYQELLQHKVIQEFKNSQDSDGDTPLHKAIKNRNKDLTEILFTMEDIYWNIKNKDQKTAIDLLEEASHDSEWTDLCKIIGVDPRLKITYIQRKTDVTQMRETISLVAALLATITFTAGFTLPGGFNTDGEAVLAKKAAFLVFLVTDTYAMCCSMLILFSIIWSMVCDSNTSSFLADRSLGLLKHSLYGTLLAFMGGVYIVTHKKSLWIAIVVIIMCSLTVILAQRHILYKMFEIFNSVTEKALRMQMQLSSWEMWTSYSKRGNQQPTASNNQGQNEEAAPLTDQSEHREITTPVDNHNQGEEAIAAIIRMRLLSCWNKGTSCVKSVFRGNQQTTAPNNQGQDEEATPL